MVTYSKTRVDRAGQFLAEALLDAGRHEPNIEHGTAVEAQARVTAPGLKFGGGPASVRQYFVALAEMVASLDQGRQPDQDLLDRLNRLKAGVDTFRELAE